LRNSIEFSAPQALDSLRNLIQLIVSRRNHTFPTLFPSAMDVIEDYNVIHCGKLPGLDKSRPASNSQNSLQNSSSSDEKISTDLNEVDLGVSTQLEQPPSPAVERVLDELELRLVDDDYVKWRTNASAHPRNWTAARKTYDTGLVLLLDLFTWVTRDQLSTWINADNL
jgi:hypothetical protein